jgi:putative inorganic carbon (hco3(-)) transporter
MSIEIVAVILAGVVPAAFFLGLRTGIATLLIIRPLCDRLFELGRFDFAGYSITYGAIMNVVVICAILCNVGPIWRRVPSGLKTTWLPFLLMASIALLYSPVQFDGFRRFMAYVSFAGMFMLSFVLVKSERDVLFFLKVVILSSILPVLYGLIQIASGTDWFLDSRIHSTFSHPNTFAFYILITIGAIFFLLSTERLRISGNVRLFLNIYLIPLLIVLVMTKTRSAWLGCLVLFFVYGLVYDKRALVFVLVAPIIALAIPAVSERLMDLASGNAYVGGSAVTVNAYAWRQILWESSFHYIWQQPIFGYGLDSFSFHSRVFFPIDAVSGASASRTSGVFAHNVYIQFLFETGFVGLVSFFWIFWRCFAWLNRSWRLDKRGLTITGAILVVYLIVGYSDNLFEYLSFDWCFWFTIGLIFAQSERYRAYDMEKRKAFGRQLRAGGTAGVPAARPGLAS